MLTWLRSQEWKSYRAQTSYHTKILEKQIQQLAKIATLPEKPAEFRVLNCLGAFKDSAHRRYGFVYILPRYLWTMKAEALKDGSVSPRRKPTSLLSLIRGEDPNYEEMIPPELDLGSRIALAKKLAQSLLLLHSANWVHKK
jgi:hypothetical protein